MYVSFLMALNCFHKFSVSRGRVYRYRNCIGRILPGFKKWSELYILPLKTQLLIISLKIRFGLPAQLIVLIL